MASENITFYSTNDTYDTINKTLSQLASVTGNYFIRNTSLIEPELDIQTTTSIANANIFLMCGRYYNITECTMLNGGLFRVRGKLDAYTYKDTILLCRALIDRSEDNSIINKNLVNPDKLSETRTFDTIYNLSGGDETKFLDEPVLILTALASNEPVVPEE